MSEPKAYNYNALLGMIKTSVDGFISRNEVRDLIGVRKVEVYLLGILKSPKNVAKVGFDPTFHLKFQVVVNPIKKHCTVCINPLTPVGLDFCLAMKIPVDESLQNQIRKIYNESLASSN